MPAVGGGRGRITAEVDLMVRQNSDLTGNFSAAWTWAWAWQGWLFEGDSGDSAKRHAENSPPLMAESPSITARVDEAVRIIVAFWAGFETEKRIDAHKFGAGGRGRALNCAKMLD